MPPNRYLKCVLCGYRTFILINRVSLCAYDDDAHYERQQELKAMEKEANAQ